MATSMKTLLACHQIDDCDIAIKTADRNFLHNALRHIEFRLI